MRFRMLETVREFAADRLSRADFRDDAQRGRTTGPRAVRRGPRRRALRTRRDRRRRRPRRRGEQPRRRAPPRDCATATAPWSPACWPRLGALLDDHRQPPARVRHRRRRRGAPWSHWDPPDELRETAQLVLSWLVVAPELDAAPLDRRAAGHARALGRPRPSVGAGGATRCSSTRREPESAPTTRGWPPWPTAADPVTAQMALLWAGPGRRERRRHRRCSDGVRPGGAHAPAADAVPRGLAARPARPARHVLGRPPRRRREHADVAVAHPAARLHADDDARSMRPSTAMNALLDGDVDAAERILDEIARRGRRGQLGLADGADRRAGRARPGPWAGRRRAAALRRGRWPASSRSRASTSAALSPGCCWPRRARWSLASGTARRPPTRLAPRELRDLLVQHCVGHRRSTASCRTPTSRSTACCSQPSVPRVAGRRLRGRARRRRTPARPRRPLVLQPQLPDDVVGRPARARRTRRHRASSTRLPASTPTGRWPISSRRPGACWGASHLPGEGPHRQRSEDRDHREAAEQRPPTSAVTVPVLARSRSAVTMWVTGLTLVKASSQSGRVSAGTNALDRNVSGNITISE